MHFISGIEQIRHALWRTRLCRSPQRQQAFGREIRCLSQGLYCSDASFQCSDRLVSPPTSSFFSKSSFQLVVSAFELGVYHRILEIFRVSPHLESHNLFSLSVSLMSVHRSTHMQFSWGFQQYWLLEHYSNNKENVQTSQKPTSKHKQLSVLKKNCADF